MSLKFQKFNKKLPRIFTNQINQINIKNFCSQPFLKKSEIKIPQNEDEEKIVNDFNDAFLAFSSPRFLPLENFEDLPSNFIDTKKLINQFKKPNSLQSLCWPVMLNKKNLVCVNPHDRSGKTLTMALSIIENSFQTPKTPSEKPFLKSLLITPSEKRAEKIKNTINQLLNNTQLNTPLNSQFLVGTFESINNAAKSSKIFEKVDFFIIDEIDRFLQYDLYHEIAALIAKTNSKRKIAIFSHFWNDDVSSFATEFLIEPFLVKLGESSMRVNPNKKQEIIVTTEKFKSFQKILKKLGQKKVIVFFDKFIEVKKMNFLLKKDFGVETKMLYGFIDEPQIKSSLDDFEKSQNHSILLTTHQNFVNFDISDFKNIINYDMPKTIMEYVLKLNKITFEDEIGTNTYFTLFSPENSEMATKLIEVLKHSNEMVPSDLAKMA